MKREISLVKAFSAGYNDSCTWKPDADGCFLPVIGHIALTDHIVPIVQGSSGHGNHGSHESHVSHASHSDHGSHSNTHSSHASHTSHSNTSAHSNSAYSSEGDVTYKAPAAADVPTIKTPVVTATADTFKLPDVNQNIELPNGTPASSIMRFIGSAGV